MARAFANSFYSSKAWRMCRQSYIEKMPLRMRGLCEECYKNGKYVPGEELHHNIHLNEHNIDKPEITLNHKNLIFLCFDCHQRMHGKRSEELEYEFDENGNLKKKE